MEQTIKKPTRRQITGPSTATLLFATFVLAWFYPAAAQQPKKVPQIGYVSFSGDPNAPGPWVEAFRRGLRDLGYIEGKNILV